MSPAVAEQSTHERIEHRPSRSRRGRPRQKQLSGPRRTKVQMEFTEDQLSRLYKLREILGKKTHGEVIGYSLALTEWLHDNFLNQGYELCAVKDGDQQKLAFIVS